MKHKKHCPLPHSRFFVSSILLHSNTTSKIFHWIRGTSEVHQVTFEFFLLKVSTSGEGQTAPEFCCTISFVCCTVYVVFDGHSQKPTHTNSLCIFCALLCGMHAQFKIKIVHFLIPSLSLSRPLNTFTVLAYSMGLLVVVVSHVSL
jgi:hypothetical protein